VSIHLRRSVRLFPGVRLNFSKSGISTSMEVRAEDLKAGLKGAALNLGLPHAAPAAPPAGPAASKDFAHWTPYTSYNRVEEETEPESEETATLTGAGLGNLQALLNDAAVRRTELAAGVAEARRELERAKAGLRFARSFIIRLVTVEAVPKLAQTVEEAAKDLDDAQDRLDACFVEVDFGLSAGALKSYSTLIDSFEALAACDAIWDIGARGKDGAAAESVGRTPVRFGLSDAALVKCQHVVGRMDSAAGRDIYLFPAFVMTGGGADPVRLFEYREFELSLAPTRFIEEDEAPPDAEQVGETWKKVNEDGSPDERFADNPVIPILLYGEMLLRTPASATEAYVVSNYTSAGGFAVALEAHKQALAKLQAEGGAPASAEAPTEADVVQPKLEELVHRPPVDTKPRSFAADWAVIVLLLAGLGWAVLHNESTRRAPPPAPLVVQLAPKAMMAVTAAAPAVAAEKSARRASAVAPAAAAKKPARPAPAAKARTKTERAVEDERAPRRAGPELTPARLCDRVHATINPDAVTCR